MNLRQVARQLSGFTLFFSLSLLVPLIVSLFETDEWATRWPFTWALAIGLATTLVLWLIGRGDARDFFRREGLAVVGLAWFLAGALAAVPFSLSGAIPSYVDAYFESISGLTTTGATVLGSADNPAIEDLPHSILLWRSLIQWMGGIGIIVVFVVLLPSMGATGSRLLSSEQVGVSDESNRLRMADQGRVLFTIYMLLSTAAALSYWAVGLSFFDAICHGMTTMSTAGFSNNNQSIGGYQNLGVEIVAMVFMFLAGCNFLLLVRYVLRNSRVGRSLIHLTEFRVYISLTLAIAICITATLWFYGEQVHDPALGITHDYGSLTTCIRHGFFQTLTILTTTGYCTTDFQVWPHPALCLLVIAMFVGGCTGSTAGGFKVLRVVVCSKLIRHSIRHFVSPRSVETLRVGSENVANHVVSAMLGLLLLWIGVTAAGAFILNLDPRLDLVSAASASLSMMGCVGPAISEVNNVTGELVGQLNLGPYGGFGGLEAGAKLFMALQMVLGRLEILAPLALLTPGFWRR